MDLTAQVFGYLTVLRRDENRSFWICRCVCGTETRVRTNTLRVGKSKSCGCKREELRVAKAIKPDFRRIRNAIFKGYRGAAKRRGYVFELTFEQFVHLMKQTCFYCGVEPNTLWDDSHRLKNPESGRLYYNGVDRRDNSIGYVLSNCVTCCADCNRAKGSLSEETWLTWVQRLHQYQFSKEGSTTSRET